MDWRKRLEESGFGAGLGRAMLVLAGLLGAWGVSAEPPAAPQKVIVADQTGPGHLVTVVMRDRRLLEKQFPNTRFEWKVVSSGAVVRDGMMADQIQVGIYAPPPYLIGLDKGLKWKIIAAAATYDQWLVAKDPKYRSLKDLKEDPKAQIGVAGFDSFPAIVLRKAAQKEFGDPRALDTKMLSMGPPQAVQLVLSGQLAAALVPPIHSVRAVDGGARVILKGNDVFSGPVTNNFYVMTQSFYDRYPQFAQAFYDAVGKAIRFIQEHPGEAYAMLSQDQGGKLSADQYRDWITRSGTEFSPVPQRVLEVARYMKAIGMIKEAPGAIQDISFPPLGGAGS